MPGVKRSDSDAQRTKPRGVTTKRVRGKIKMDPSFRWDDECSEDPIFAGMTSIFDGMTNIGGLGHASVPA